MPYLWVVTAICDILQEAENFTLGQSTTVLVLHHILTLLDQKGGFWLTAGYVGKYQVILLDNSKVTLQITTTLNLAMLLLDMERDSSPA